MLLRLRSLIAAAPSTQRLPLFSSSAASSPKNRMNNIFEDGKDGGSAVYEHALKFSKPGTIDLKREKALKYSRPSTMNLLKERLHLRNSVSLIGSVERSPTPTLYKPSDGRRFVYTLLRVQNSSNPRSSFRVLVVMRDELGKLALQYMQPNDLIYVSGQLESYNKTYHGSSKLCYKVEVKEWNYVKQPDQKQKLHDEVKPSVSQEGESTLTRQKNRLHLWQVFFSSPHEWYDRRQRKTSSRSPDFVHKSTGETLWIHADDPAWIKRQLELHDSRMEAGWRVEESSSSRPTSTSSLVYDDL